MLGLPRLFRRRQTAQPAGAEGLRSLFVKFRRILDMNTRVLERMALMEQVLGGDSIFDQAFLHSSVREITSHVHQVVYSLNAMCQDRYVDLYDRYVEIKNILGDILSGGPGPHASASALPAQAIRWDMESLVGGQAARLCELRNRLALPSPDGFAVSIVGCSRLHCGGEEREQAMAAILREARSLVARSGGAGLTVTVCQAGNGAACSLATPLALDTDHDNLVQTLESALDGLLRAEGNPGEPLLSAAWVRQTVPPALVGQVDTLAQDADPALGEVLAVHVAPANDSGAVERYLMRRTYPFELLRSEIAPKSVTEHLPGSGDTPTSPRPVTRLWRGSALLLPEQLQHLAESALAAERLFGPPQLLDFLVSDKGEALFLDTAPSTAPVHQGAGQGGAEGSGPASSDEMGDDLARALAEAEVLARGGLAAQNGVAAGRVVHVDENDLPEDFPAGAVAVARRANSRLTPVLRRAAALITEVGTPAGHLATIAREARIPALFGLAGALSRIPEGTDVTVDTSEGVVYAGIIEPLLDPAASGAELFPSDPEYVTLRRLLRFIQPLRLTDPQSPEFTPEHCQSFHDIIHFAHEQAVEELLHIGKRHRGAGAVHTRRLELDVPMDMRVLDLGPGSGEGTGATMRLDEVDSEPLAAFLRGVSRKPMWDDRPMGLGLGDVVRGMQLSSTALTANPGRMAGNLAITAPNYCNVSLRLGYHFSVLDAYLGSGPNQNSVYFRFVGGLADDARRSRRTVLIQRVLEALDFTVESNGDLVTGRLRLVEGPDAVAALVRLGELTAFTRQLDMAMTSDATMEELTAWFLDAAQPAVQPVADTAPDGEVR